jgi:type VI secretion system protein ImpG
LRLYQTASPGRADKEINGISKMTTRPVVRRLGDSAWRGFCRGTQVNLEFNEREYVGSSAFMLASALDQFFALHAAVNSFTELAITSTQRSGVWYRWPAKSGQVPLL